jgi:DNA-directed RNA polymerase subunit RPC12/RpoP
MPDKRQEELWCHDCTNYVQFMLDYDLDGRHVLNCPKCGHEHYRIIRKGRITAERWGQDPRQQNMPTYYVTSCTATTSSMDVVWLNATNTNSWTSS